MSELADDDLTWITFEVREHGGQRRGFDTRVHPTREAARAYADAHGRVVASTRDKTAGRAVGD